ncbi:hypothetical protein HAX54_049245, partial [Datura stramonium]|nr:hypothetical protein [Datura stramonium]
VNDASFADSLGYSIVVSCRGTKQGYRIVFLRGRFTSSFGWDVGASYSVVYQLKGLVGALLSPRGHRGLR